MYTQYFLKFESQEQCYEVLTGIEWYGSRGESDGFILDGHAGAIDEVGLIVDVSATYDEETFEELTPTTYVDGWHINVVLRDPLPEELQEFAVTPTTPSRIFAGFEV